MSEINELFFAAQWGDIKKIRSLLIDTDISLETKENDMTALHYAAQYGCPECVQELLNWGAVMDSEDKYYHWPPPLSCGVWAGHLSCVKVLLKYGADPNYNDNYEQIERVWNKGRIECVIYCLQHGTDVNKPYSYEYTNLHWAAYHDQLDFLRELLKCGADINQLTNDNECNIPKGYTALDIAKKRGNYQIVSFLEEYDPKDT